MLMTEERKRQPKRGTADMTEFGRTLNRLMVYRELYEWQDLLAKLEEVDYKIGQPRLTGYLYGDRNPRKPRELFDAIAKALDLTDEEKSRLMYSYGYPQEKATSEHWDKATDFEDEIRSELEDEGKGSRGDEDTGV